MKISSSQGIISRQLLKFIIILSILGIGLNIQGNQPAYATVQQASNPWFCYWSYDDVSGALVCTSFYTSGNMIATTQVVAYNYETIIQHAAWGAAIPYGQADCWTNVGCDMDLYVRTFSKDSYGSIYNFPNYSSVCTYPPTYTQSCGDTLVYMYEAVYNINGAATINMNRSVVTNDDIGSIYNYANHWSLNSF